MELEVLRYSSGEETTLGLLSIIDVPRVPTFLCYTLEDEYRARKVAGETRIPAGTYKVTLRTIGGKNARYAKRFPDMHKGMLWVRNVPGFKYILIHIGNDEDDTEGCLLVGNSVTENLVGVGIIGASKNAYSRIYPLIADRIAAGEEVTITYTNCG